MRLFYDPKYVGTMNISYLFTNFARTSNNERYA